MNKLERLAEALDAERMDVSVKNLERTIDTTTLMKGGGAKL